MEHVLALDLKNDPALIAQYEARHRAVWPEVRKATESDPVIQRWEQLMWTFQAPTPWTPSGEKWVPMARIFDWRSNASPASVSS